MIRSQLYWTITFFGSFPLYATTVDFEIKQSECDRSADLQIYLRGFNSSAALKLMSAPHFQRLRINWRIDSSFHDKLGRHNEVSKFHINFKYEAQRAVSTSARGHHQGH